MEEYDNNIARENTGKNILIKSRKYAYIALSLGALSLLFSLICFVEYVFNVLSIACGLGAFVFAMLGMNSNRRGRGIFGVVIAFIGITLSLFFLITTIKEFKEVSNQAKNTSNEVGIYLVDKRPVFDTYNIDTKLYILQGSYLYDYSEEEMQVFINNINDKWKQEKVAEELRLYLQYFTLIPEEFFIEEGYYVYYNLDLNSETFDSDALYYNFVFIYFDKDNKFDHDIYLYTFEKYQDYTNVLE